MSRYLNEFTARYIDRPSDTIDQMVQGMGGKRLRFRDLPQGEVPCLARLESPRCSA